MNGTPATNETRIYWCWDQDQQKFVKELPELPREKPKHESKEEMKEEECVVKCWDCMDYGLVMHGFDDVKDCPYCTTYCD